MNKLGGVRFAEQVNSTPLVALVGSGDTPSFSPRKLKLVITHTDDAAPIELSFPTAVHGVRINQKRLVVVLETKILVYEIHSLRLLHSIATGPNREGLCVLCAADSSLIAFCARESGKVYVFDTLRLLNVALLEAHNGSIACMAFNHDGTLLATASEKGTILRVFRVFEKAKVAELRRGTQHTHIYDIAFSPDSSLVCCASKTGTVHVWRLEGPSDPNQPQQPSLGAGLYSWVSSYATAYLPVSLSSAWEPVRSTLSIRLPFPGLRCACAFLSESGGSEATHLLVASYDGVIYKYRLHPFSLVSEDTLIPSIVLEDHHPALPPSALLPPQYPLSSSSSSSSSPQFPLSSSPSSSHYPPLPPSSSHFPTPSSSSAAASPPPPSTIPSDPLQLLHPQPTSSSAALSPQQPSSVPSSTPPSAPPLYADPHPLSSTIASALASQQHPPSSQPSSAPSLHSIAYPHFPSLADISAQPLMDPAAASFYPAVPHPSTSPPIQPPPAFSPP